MYYTRNSGIKTVKMNDSRKMAFLGKKKNTTVGVFLEIKCHSRDLFNSVFSVLGANKNPTRFSKYGSVRPENDKRKQGGGISA